MFDFRYSSFLGWLPIYLSIRLSPVLTVSPCTGCRRGIAHIMGIERRSYVFNGGERKGVSGGRASGGDKDTTSPVNAVPSSICSSPSPGTGRADLGAEQPTIVNPATPPHARGCRHEQGGHRSLSGGEGGGRQWRSSQSSRLEVSMNENVAGDVHFRGRSLVVLVGSFLF